MSLTELIGGKAEQPAPAPPTVNDDSVQAAAEAERKRRALARGRAATIMTSGQGVSEYAPTSAAALLGG